ncbi:MAG TPA: Crp/Fnr family transcriptional regulator [Bryobacteraceae bacterium]|nr:Crp/Fnr family transcriptional regulator [Bryobacteraceae bacterium]
MSQRPNLVSALKAVALFAPLDDSELEFIAARSGLKSYDAGELLFSEGDPCAGLYVVASGRVRIFKTSPSGREHVLAIEGPGSSIAELPVFDGGPYPASAAALEKSELVFVSRRDFRALCLEHPEVALKVLQVVGARLRRLVGIIEELSFTTVRHRLISWLLRQAKTEGRPAGRGFTFSLGASHQELAAQIGTVRELVSRNMARLQAQGLIEINGREVVIPDLESLEADLASVV